MIFTAENILLIGSILLFVSIVVGKTGYRFGVPALLLFLLVGMLFGSDGLGLQFHNAKIAQFIGMVALSVILFSEVWILNSKKFVLFFLRESYFQQWEYFSRHFYRIIHLVSFGNELDQYPLSIDHFPITCIYHVVNGFCFSIRHPPFAKDESET